MLKKIAVAQLRAGMFVHDLGLSWWQHDFVRARFALDSDVLLAKVRATGVKSVVIDTDKGIDVADQPLAAGALSSSLGAAPAMPTAGEAGPEGSAVTPGTNRPGSSSPIRSTTSLSEEIHAARRLIRDASAAVEQAMQEARAGKIASTPKLRDLAHAMVESTGRNAGALLTLTGLKTKDNYTFMHCVAVGTFMIALGRLLGLSDAQLCDAGTAGLLHDVGKAGVPDSILNKPARLTPDEMDVVRRHPELGYTMLRESGYEESAALEVVLHHHERLDGQGYPHKLSGEQVTPLARMGAVVDVYDAVTSERVYHSAMPPSAALKMLLSSAGTHFDESIVRAFIRTVGIFPNGSLVRLASGRLAVVVEQHATDAMTPRVRVFFSTRSNMHVPEQEVDLARSSDKIERYEDPLRWGFDLSRYTAARS